MAGGRRARSPLAQPVDGRRRQAAGIDVRHPAPAGETLARLEATNPMSRGSALGLLRFLQYMLPLGGRHAPDRQARLADQIHIGELRIRSEEHTSELQSLMRLSYAGFCLKKKT